MKTAIVTGSGRGTGHAIAEALKQAGWRVIGFDINPETADEVVDVSNKMSVQTAFYTLLETHEKLDLLVNAAHVVPHSIALKLDEWEWNRVLDVNLKGAFLVAQNVARAMKETGGGLIVNVLRDPQVSPHAAVRAAREGLIGLTVACHTEWSAFGVRVETLECAATHEATAQKLLEKL